MDKIVKYIEAIIPMQACTLRCSYCYLSLREHNFTGGLPHFSFDASFFRKVLSKDRLEGVARINFCGDGETLLVPNMVDYVRELLDEGHWVDIVTNGTVTKVMQQLASLKPEYRERLFFKISFHYLELKKRNLLETFFANIQTIQQAGISFTLLLTASDDYIPYAEEIKRICLDNVGALPHVSFARDDLNPSSFLLSNMSQAEYYQYWSGYDSALFEFQNRIFGVKRTEFCMAGRWSYVLNMQTGELRQCHGGAVIQNVYEHIDKPFKKFPVGNYCRTAHCICGPIWLTMGVIPDMQTPRYDTMRNRTTKSGDWLNPQQQKCMHQSLAENNHIPNCFERMMYNARMLASIYYPKMRRKIRRYL